MIERDEIATAARNADRSVEIYGLVRWIADHDLNIDGLMYVAEQRALRTAMLMDGQDPTKRTTRLVYLPPRTRAIMPLFQSAWLDGFAAAFTLQKEKS